MPIAIKLLDLILLNLEIPTGRVKRFSVLGGVAAIGLFSLRSPCLLSLNSLAGPPQ